MAKKLKKNKKVVAKKNKKKIIKKNKKMKATPKVSRPIMTEEERKRAIEEIIQQIKAI